MGFRLKDAETLPDGIRRITLDQVDRSLDRLELKTRNKDRAIHEARVGFKRIRSILRLIRGEIGQENFKLENQTYRDAGRQLSAARDTAVVADTLEELIGECNKHLAQPDIKLLRKRLRRLRADQLREKAQQLPQIAEDIQHARVRVAEWPLNHDGFVAIEYGLRKTYRQGRRKFETAQSDNTTSNLHEWRKDVKYLWYQLTALNALWPKPLDAFASELSKLSGFLSEDHDLAMLRERASKQSETLTESTEITNLIQLLDHRRTELQTKARTLGLRLYAEKPRAFSRRMESFWNAWRPGTVRVEEQRQPTLVSQAASNDGRD
jgi:CHAD domain-containing protein